MDLLDEARRNASLAWWRGRRWFGPVLGEDEALAIGVATVFEVQAATPDAPPSDVARAVRTRVLNCMRDEVRFLRRELPLEPDLAVTTSAPSPESRLDQALRVEWLADEVGGLPWNDRRLLEATLLASTQGGKKATLPRRFGSRWTVRRSLDRVVLRLQQGAARRFGGPAPGDATSGGPAPSRGTR